METSFFEYRNGKGNNCDSDSDEIIDNSFNNSFILQKKLMLSAKKNKTVVIPESDDSQSNDDTENYDIDASFKLPKNKSENALISNDESEIINRNSSVSQMQKSFSNVVISSSSEDEDMSPEIIPRRRPSRKSSTDSPLIRRVRKRIVLSDSENDNSIIIENKNHNKVPCMKDTPMKILTNVKKLPEPELTDDEDEGKSDISEDERESDEYEGKSNEEDDKSDEGEDKSDDQESESDNRKNDNCTSDEGPDEYDMAVSKATRMSIMGYAPNALSSDESDFIQDESNTKSKNSIASTNTTNELPDSGLTVPSTPEKDTTDNNSSRISCSPFGSPAANQTIDEVTYVDSYIDMTDKKFNVPKQSTDSVKSNIIVYDEDVTVIESVPEVIALSSDDEDQKSDSDIRKSKSPKKSPRTSKSPDKSSSRSKENTMKQYLVPPSYPNQVVYVKKSVRENELNQLNRLNEEMKNLRHLLDHMDLSTLPDRGKKLIERLTGLEANVRIQGDKVANMVVEPDNPTKEQMVNDGFGNKMEGLSWDDIQKASNQVQPRMFGKQAMSTHMAERNLILDRLRDLHSSLASRPPDSSLSPPPLLLSTPLMVHQKSALTWLTWRETQKPPGGILADDMGLGKTITMISLILKQKETNIDDDDGDDSDEWRAKGNSKLKKGGTLVVATATLLQQWEDEVSKHCKPHALTVCQHHGPSRATQPHRLTSYDIVITSYNILQREHDGVLSKIFWRRIVLDEAHIVRNHKSQTSVSVANLKAKHRWCLTGTPLHNKDLDVYTLLKFLRCTPFDDLTMWKKWIDNKSAGGQERLNTIMRCLLLRRTKQQLQEKGELKCLPKREVLQIDVTLDKEEMNVYQKVLVFSKTLFAQFLHQRAERQQNGFVSGSLPGKNDAYEKMHKRMVALQGAKPVKSHEILVLLLRLRQVCGHCGLIANMLEGGSDKPDAAGVDLMNELNKLTLEDQGKQVDDKDDYEPQESMSVQEAIRSVLSPNNPVFNMARRSSKITAVMDCLNKNVFANKGEKAIVVSQWTSVLRLVESQLKKSGIKCCTLSGEVSVNARAPLVKAINDPNSDVKVMLLSLCAGGVGLNLCGANHLLLLDPHWNPQLEQQAQDRVYRVGQKKDVHIYRFKCLDTIEEMIRKLQEAKLEIAENILTGAKHNNASKLSIEDLKMLFNMGQ